MVNKPYNMTPKRNMSLGDFAALQAIWSNPQGSPMPSQARREESLIKGPTDLWLQEPF